MALVITLTLVLVGFLAVKAKGSTVTERGDAISLGKEEFEAKFAQAARNVDWAGFPWRFALGLSKLETGNGNNSLTRYANNLFSIKIGTGWKTGGWKGKTYYIKGNDNFRAYDSWEDSMRDFRRLIGFDIYQKAYTAAMTGDAEGFYREIKAAGYDVSEPKYAEAAFKRYQEIAV